MLELELSIQLALKLSLSRPILLIMYLPSKPDQINIDFQANCHLEIRTLLVVTRSAQLKSTSLPLQVTGPDNIRQVPLDV